MFKSNLLALSFASVLIATSCGGDKPKEDDTNTDTVIDTDTAKTAVLNVGGELFSVPSPIQTAMLIQKSGVAYDKSILNVSNKANTYTNDFMRSLNLGIYGADLGYVSMYNQTQDAIGYLAAVKQLADKLGVSAAFDTGTMKRINDNIANKDSMLVLVGIAYRASDAYLKTNKRTEVSSLILAGGWIESMHFSVTAYKQKQGDEVKYRIAEQKQALGSIIKLLASNTAPEAIELGKQLSDLAKVYEGIQFKYTFVEPTTDSLKKMTYINSTNEVIVSKEQIDQISAKITEIRTKITNVQS
ncbi:MAG: hypothetical protein IPJ32_11325 [Sphingobacteriaceae bacterium]|nr:hypothetical protein [Sphingobacteriaceae bacterium]